MEVTFNYAIIKSIMKVFNLTYYRSYYSLIVLNLVKYVIFTVN